MSVLGNKNERARENRERKKKKKRNIKTNDLIFFSCEKK
jgi:hypothetical protein